MDRMGKKELINTIDKQKEQIARYETRLRDVVIAYKSLVKEKEALEASLKALSGSKTSVVQTDSEETTSKEGETVTKSNNETTKVDNSDASKSIESCEHLRAQLQTLTDSLATLSAEKSRMEARFQADKKQLRQERDEREKTIKELQEKLQTLTQQHQTELESVKSKLIIERHERDKERNDHGVMIRELQKLLSEERRSKEQLEMQVEDLKSRSASLESQTSQKEQYEKRIRELQNDIEVVSKKLKKAEAKAKETPPLLLELQEEMSNMKSQHQAAILAEQKRAEEAEEKVRKIAVVHEERVASLEARLAELSSTIGTYNRQLQQDQVIIQKLKDQLFQHDIEQANLPTGDLKFNVDAEEFKVKTEIDCRNDVQSIIDKIFYLKGMLEEANHNSEKSIDFSALWNNDSNLVSDGSSQHRMCKDEYNRLKQEFESYKQQVQRQPATTIRNEDSEREIQSLKGQIKSLKERIRILNVQVEDVEKEYKQEVDHLEKLVKAERASSKAAVASCEADFRARLSLMEQQLQKQRERMLALLEDKDQEIKVLKSSFQSLLPSRSPSQDNQTRRISRNDLGLDGDLVLSNLASSSDSPHVLHYAHELARRDVEISSLRRERHQLEATLRELRRLSATESERHAADVQHLQDEIERLNHCQSREGANLEYLKNVVLCFLVTTDSSSKRHMLNAITAVLKFSDAEQEKLNHLYKHL